MGVERILIDIHTNRMVSVDTPWFYWLEYSLPDGQSCGSPLFPAHTVLRYTR